MKVNGYQIHMCILKTITVYIKLINDMYFVFMCDPFWLTLSVGESYF